MADQKAPVLELDGIPDMTEEEADKLFGQKAEEEKAPEPKYADDGTLLFPDDEDGGSDDNPEVEEDGEEEDSTKSTSNKDDEDSEDSEEESETEYKPGSILQSIKEQYGLEIKDIPEGFTAAQEAQTLSEVLERTSQSYKDKVAALENYDTLVSKDEEVQQFLQMKAQGKTLKDIVQSFSGQAAFMGDDVHMANYLKDTYGFNENQIQDEISKMKEAGVYEDRKKTVAEAAVKREQQIQAYREQQAAAELQAQQDEYDKYVNGYKDFLDKTGQIGDFQLSGSMKKDLHSFATNLDQDGYTKLERAVQSNENALKASLAIKYWDDFVKVVSSSASEKTKKSLLDQLETDPSQLQSSSHKKKDTVQVSEDLANSF